MDDIDFKTKYLMYKAKYLNLKNNRTQSGGGNNNKDDVILFKSEDCGHCKDLKTWEALQKQFAGKHNFITYDYKENPEKMEEFNMKDFNYISCKW